MEKLKKLFGGINLTWVKLIIFAAITGVYTAIMALLPYAEDTSFRDIAIQFEWWVLFGILIICNSKSAIDSCLKCFVFFLISQPLIYLIQVPFSEMGFELFIYYKYRFMWTLLTIPMGYIGYYIKKNNFLSVVILLPMLLLLAYTGIGYLSATIENFPHHLLSFIACFGMIVIIILGLFDKLKLKLTSFALVVIFISLAEYNIEGKAYVSTFTGTAKGDVKLIPFEDSYNIKLMGKEKGKYTFEITDENENVYKFEYHFEKDENSVAINKTN